MNALSLQMGVGGQTWGQKSATGRAWAGASSVAITLLLLLALGANQHSGVQGTADEPRSVAVTIVPIYLPALRSVQATPAAARTQNREREKATALGRDSGLADQISGSVHAGQGTFAIHPHLKEAGDEQPKAVEEAERAASGPIRLDARTIRLANAASKSAVQLLAEQSGQDLTSTVRSSGAILQGGVAEARQPDCIPRDGEGPGLLNVFFIPARIAMKKCKFSSSH